MLEAHCGLRLSGPQINLAGLQAAALASALAVKSAGMYSVDWDTARELEDQRKREEYAKLNADHEREEAEAKKAYEASLLAADEARRTGHKPHTS